ncbi:Uncharacterised protein [uncultured archaeon]|nr:Uncharacterised protein [uncultured archaeon]
MVTITDLLNRANDVGFFSYVLPFLLIFAVIFAILQKTKIFGDSKDQANVKSINAIVAVSIALLSLLNDYVSTFFATLFPRFGIVVGIFIVILILLGFFYTPKADGTGGIPSWIGWVLLVVVLYWAIDQWSLISGIGFGGTYTLQWFVDQYLWGVLILGGVGFLIYKMMK